MNYDETFQPANLGTWENLFEGLCSATFAEACRENTCSFASIHTPQLRQLSLSHVTLLLHLSNWAISTGSNNIARRDVSRASLAITTKLRLLWQRGSSPSEAPISNINTVVSTPVFALPLSATHTIQSAAFTQYYKFFVEQFFIVVSIVDVNEIFLAALLAQNLSKYRDWANAALCTHATHYWFIGADHREKVEPSSVGSARPNFSAAFASFCPVVGSAGQKIVSGPRGDRKTRFHSLRSSREGKPKTNLEGKYAFLRMLKVYIRLPSGCKRFNTGNWIMGWMGRTTMHGSFGPLFNFPC